MSLRERYGMRGYVSRDTVDAMERANTTGLETNKRAFAIQREHPDIHWWDCLKMARQEMETKRGEV